MRPQDGHSPKPWAGLRLCRPHATGHDRLREHCIKRPRGISVSSLESALNCAATRAKPLQSARLLHALAIARTVAIRAPPKTQRPSEPRTTMIPDPRQTRTRHGSITPVFALPKMHASYRAASPLRRSRALSEGPNSLRAEAGAGLTLDHPPSRFSHRFQHAELIGYIGYPLARTGSHRATARCQNSLPYRTTTIPQLPLRLPATEATSTVTKRAAVQASFRLPANQTSAAAARASATACSLSLRRSGWCQQRPLTAAAEQVTCTLRANHSRPCYRCPSRNVSTPVPQRFVAHLLSTHTRTQTFHPLHDRTRWPLST